MAAKPLPETEWLRERFSYDPDTGELRWKTRPLSDFPNQHHCDATNARFAGKLAGSPGKWGHGHVCVGYTRFLAHRIIWKMQTGTDPVDGIDHRDGNPTNNRWNNLREADQARNNQNRRRQMSASGFKCVRLDKRSGAFSARLTVAGKYIHLGMFRTAEAAHAAYVEAAKRHFGEFFNPG